MSSYSFQRGRLRRMLQHLDLCSHIPQAVDTLQYGSSQSLGMGVPGSSGCVPCVVKVEVRFQRDICVYAEWGRDLGSCLDRAAVLLG